MFGLENLVNLVERPVAGAFASPIHSHNRPHTIMGSGQRDPGDPGPHSGPEATTPCVQAHTVVPPHRIEGFVSTDPERRGPLLALAAA